MSTDRDTARCFSFLERTRNATRDLTRCEQQRGFENTVPTRSSSSTERVNTGPCGVIESEVHPRASIRRGGGRRKATQKRKKKKKKISKRTWWISKWDQVYILEQGRSYPSRSLRRNVGRYIILEEGGNTCLIQFQEQAPRRPFNFSSANRASPLPPFLILSLTNRPDLTRITTRRIPSHYTSATRI